MNKSNSRGESNAKLLHLLSKRTDNDHLLFTKTHWPGSKRPSLTSTIHIRNLKQSRSTPRLPSNQTRRTSKSLRTSFKTNQIVSSSKSLSLVPKTNRAILEKIRSLTGRTDKHKEKNNHQKDKNVEIFSKKSAKDDLEGYEVDYMAFNYIGKVIDAPELWSKYVHKKNGF